MPDFVRANLVSSVTSYLNAVPRNDPDAELLCSIMSGGRLHAVFQPILDLRRQTVAGYEGLIRGPQSSPLHTPLALFDVAKRSDLTLELESCCRETVLRSFALLGLPGMLFYNVSPCCFEDPSFLSGETLSLLHEVNLSPSRLVIELIENQQVADFAALRGALSHFRNRGYRIAIDDLGEGFSNLRMWSEVRPEFVKIDRHFISGIADDSLKFRFVKAMTELAENCGARVIAEGIETEAELTTVRDLGITYGQGFFIGRPVPEPEGRASVEALRALRQRQIIVFPSSQEVLTNGNTAQRLLRSIPSLLPHEPNEHVFQRFEGDPDLEVLPVVNEAGVPLGLINRHSLTDRFARPFRRELFGKRNCTLFMDPSPLVVDEFLPLPEIGLLVAAAGRQALLDGFIITREGSYAGLGSGTELMTLITEMQISAARYANPLTQLPGNVPINEHMTRLLERKIPFAACYFDLDNFKPYNDCYGYRRGDDMIQLLGRIVSEIANPHRDFVGHIGGDDFIVLFQSDDWEERCARALSDFDEFVLSLISPEDRLRGGFVGEDRKGRVVVNSLPSLSIGAVHVDPQAFPSHHAVAAFASSAKKQAKKQPGSCLFIERRRPQPPEAGEPRG